MRNEPKDAYGWVRLGVTAFFVFAGTFLGLFVLAIVLLAIAGTARADAFTNNDRYWEQRGYERIIRERDTIISAIQYDKYGHMKPEYVVPHYTRMWEQHGCEGPPLDARVVEPGSICDTLSSIIRVYSETAR